MRVATSPMIYLYEDWAPLADFGDPRQLYRDHRVIAHYGKAVGSYDMTPERSGMCTGFLINGQSVITAKHCNEELTAYIGSGPPLEITVNFRNWGLHWAELNDYAYGRLWDLDPRQRGTFPDIRLLTEFKCGDVAQLGDHLRPQIDMSTASWGRRDIYLATCRGNQIPNYGLLYPGDIWGHVNLQPGRQPSESELSLVTYNNLTGDGTKQLLLSPDGLVFSSASPCGSTISFTPHDPYDNCFAYFADTDEGSSGGPIFDDSTFAVFGVLHAGVPRAAGVLKHCKIDFWNPRETECDTRDFWWPGIDSYETGTYLPDPVSIPAVEFEVRDVPNTGLFVTGTVKGWGFGGTSSLLVCPDDMVAVGVVGNTFVSDNPLLDGHVGNFGLVCAPLVARDSSGAYRRPAELLQVVVGGSTSTDPQRVRGNFDFNSYINEVLDRGTVLTDGASLEEVGTLPERDFVEQEQSFTLCPPDHVMYGIRVRHDLLGIAGVIRIECVNTQRVQTQHCEVDTWGVTSCSSSGITSPRVHPRRPIGDPGLPSYYPRDTSLLCTDAKGSAFWGTQHRSPKSLGAVGIRGVWLNSGQWTESLTFLCEDYKRWPN